MPTSTPWDGTSWDITAPDIDQPIGNHYKEMYDLRKGVAIRINKEHETLATASGGGVHKQGSSRMWSLPTASIPNLQPDGSTALDAGDNGMSWHDTTTDIIYLLDDYADPTIGGGWLPMGNFLTSSAAPTTDEMLANKAYVDTNTNGDLPTTLDSESNVMLKIHAYKAQTSGYVNAYGQSNSDVRDLKGYVGATDDPAGAGLLISFTEGIVTGAQMDIGFFVAKDKYFEITSGSSSTITIIWTPLATGGGAPIDQD